MSTPMETYRTAHPDLAVVLLNFFEMGNRAEKAPHWRSVGKFVEHYATIHGGVRTQPEVINRICERLVEFGYMTQCLSGTVAGYGNRYVSVVRDLAALNQPGVLRTLNCALYGFLAVFDLYKDAVIPIVHEAANEEVQIGTAFVAGPNALVSAWHCVDDARRLSARGINAGDWQGAKIYTSRDKKTDIAVIIFNSPIFSDYPALALSEGSILQEVLAMGYPDVPGYHPTLTAEKATIASRLTAARGTIASMPTEVWTGSEVFLITARVRGGFSGGPLLDVYGNCTGVVVREPASYDADNNSHRYDDLGYGVAMQSSIIQIMLTEIASGTGPEVDCSAIEFVDFS